MGSGWVENRLRRGELYGQGFRLKRLDPDCDTTLVHGRWGQIQLTTVDLYGTA